MSTFSLWDEGACNCPPPVGVICGSCTVPAVDLTFSWTNVTPGSTPLVYNAITQEWVTACFFPKALSPMVATLECLSGQLVLSFVGWFASGICNTGTVAHCGQNPSGIVPTSFTCSPLSILYTLNGGYEDCGDWYSLVFNACAVTL